MTELDGARVGAGLQQVGRPTVTQHVWGTAFADANPARRPVLHAHLQAKPRSTDPRGAEIQSFPGEFIPVALLTVPSGARRSYAPVNCSLQKDPLPLAARTARSRPIFSLGRRAYACLGDCGYAHGREIAISRWIDSRSAQDSFGGCNTTPIPRQYSNHKSGSPCRPLLPADERTGQVFLCY
jgi:hypothetical protein